MKRIGIGHIQKHFFDGTHRVNTPEETFAIIEPLMNEIGVNEVLDITHLDRLGVPVSVALRMGVPRGGVPVHPGKGKEPLHARISAMMEAIERYSAEYRGQQMEFTSYEEIGLTQGVDPNDLILSRPLEIGERLHWSPSWDIMNDEGVYVPSNAVFHPYNSMGMAEPLFRSDTTGLAGGNAIEEAILHAIFEVINRDALSEAERDQSMGKRLIIDNNSPLRQLLEKFTDNGIEIHLWLLNGKTHIPTIAAATDDIETKDPAMLVIGSGTHSSPEIAAIRALTEVAQIRARNLQGGRHDPMREMVLKKAGYERMKRMNRIWFEEAEEIPLSGIPDLSSAYIDEDIKIAIDEIRPHAERICVCDLTRTSVPVVRVIIPGMEISYVDNSRRRRMADQAYHFSA